MLRSVKDFFTAEKKEAGAARLAAEKDAVKLEAARKKVSRAACMQMRARTQHYVCRSHSHACCHV
ncbi:MAG: hypothetical protein ACPIOQ_02950 [Promethearchaeia archaeon]